MKRKLVIYVALLLLLSCGPYIWFKVPQPENSTNLDGFSASILGKYMSVYDSAVISIESDKIIKEYRENLILSKTEFREEIGDTISEDTSFTFTENWNITIKSFGDSVKVYSSKDENVFQVSENQLLRYYKNYYFLNFKDSNEYWQVKVIQLMGDTLEFDNILTDDDLRFIKNITSIEVYTDSVNDEKEYFLKPTKRELKRILKRRLHGEKFVKLN
ncbi:MAG TPA: hypothetical protein DCG75_08905 [Bacteroidales bacterium]|nr:hypothetical protein [Bacteroidales bacterium]